LAEIITIRVKEYAAVTLAPGNVPLGEKMIVRKATGLPFEAFFADGNTIGEDSVAVLWWLARRAGGEPMLTWTQVEKEWPDNLTVDDIDVEMSDAEGDPDPEV
jgi:hypothetical protein